MVRVMGCTSGLGAAVSTAVVVVTAAVSSPDCPSQTSLDGIHGGHGFRPAGALRKKKIEPLLKVRVESSNTPWRSESLFRGRMKAKDVARVQASKANETSGEKGQVKMEENLPGWAAPNSEELPPWAKNERPTSQEPAQDVSFPVYLLGSTLVAIVAVGLVFEYFNENPVFGVIPPDSPFYTPILGIFAITGLPTAGFLFYKSIQLASKASEEVDKEDGFCW